MTKISRIRRSRDSWKDKATERSEQVREFRKTKARHQSKDRGVASASRDAGERVRAEKKRAPRLRSGGGEILSLEEASQTRVLCISLVLQAMVSFRAVPRILGLFRDRGYIDLDWVPHFTSVINWTLRYGLCSLEQVKPLQKPWLAIVDHSIDIGVKKVLVVLRVELSALRDRDSAVCLEDCECIGLQITEHTDAETVYDQMKTVFLRSGRSGGDR